MATSCPVRATRSWHLFCRVIDNYGDAGVTWRLARELAHEHGRAVTVWIDAPLVLARLVPALDPSAPDQRVDGIRVRLWDPEWRADTRADVVVEMFGAGFTDAQLAGISAQAPPPQWFVLEYLSAEPWVDAHHGLPSPHPRLPIVRRFWFPGFTAATGGLLRERDLLARRDAFMREGAARDALVALAGAADRDRALWVSLFCYPDAPVDALLAACATGGRRVVVLVPEGIAASSRSERHGAAAEGDAALTVVPVPFLPQQRYDELLWSCDLNFVRGEDSFVRAQWAAQPCVWQPYPQPEHAHAVKMSAFLDRYLSGCEPASARAMRAFWQAWNALPGARPVAAAWFALTAALPELSLHARRWSRTLADLPELAATLVSAAVDGV